MKYKIIVLIVLLIVLLLLVFYWIVLRNTTEGVSKKEPYLSILNTDFKTSSEVFLIENTSVQSLKKDYPKELTAVSNIDASRVAHIVLPDNSTVRFTKAIHFKNATSGIKYSILLGSVKLKNTSTEYNVVYNYGYFKTICIDEPCNYWEYKTEFWESQNKH